MGFNIVARFRSNNERGGTKNAEAIMLGLRLIMRHLVLESVVRRLSTGLASLCYPELGYDADSKVDTKREFSGATYRPGFTVHFEVKPGGFPQTV